MFCVYWVPQYTKNTNMRWTSTRSHYYPRCWTYLTLFNLCKYHMKKVWSPLFTDEEKHSKWGTCPSSHKWWEIELWFESISPWSQSSFSFSNIAMQLPKIMMALLGRKDRKYCLYKVLINFFKPHWPLSQSHPHSLVILRLDTGLPFHLTLFCAFVPF